MVDLKCLGKHLPSEVFSFIFVHGFIFSPVIPASVFSTFLYFITEKKKKEKKNKGGWKGMRWWDEEKKLAEEKEMSLI